MLALVPRRTSVIYEYAPPHALLLQDTHVMHIIALFQLSCCLQVLVLSAFTRLQVFVLSSFNLVHNLIAIATPVAPDSSISNSAVFGVAVRSSLQEYCCKLNLTVRSLTAAAMCFLSEPRKRWRCTAARLMTWQRIHLTTNIILV